jgi:riboflavin kinase/FMN adenylyltransferase
MNAVYRSLAEARDHFGPSAVAIGNFDGVHLGHQTLLHKAQQVARASGWKTGVLTFDPHPTAIVAPERAPRLICSLPERLRLLAEAGAEQTLVLPFDPKVARMPPDEFIVKVLVEGLTVRAVIVGQNFHFGYKQAGNTEVMSQLGDRFGFETHFVAPVAYRGEIVSSTAIRCHIGCGRMERAGRLLGRCFALEGEVVSGHGIGSKQTVPTLNLRPGLEMLPRHGVYITEAEDLQDGRRWQSITNAGVRPTFGGQETTIETFLLSPFDGRSPERLRIKFRHFLRDERPFPSPQELKTQILKDVRRAQAYWRRVERFQATEPVRAH